jgi:hypothetical protein
VDAVAGEVGVAVCNSRAGFGTTAAMLAAAPPPDGGDAASPAALSAPAPPPHPFTMAEPARPASSAAAGGGGGLPLYQPDASATGPAPGTAVAHTAPQGAGRAPFMHAAVSKIAWADLGVSRLQLVVLLRPAAVDGLVVTLLPPGSGGGGGATAAAATHAAGSGGGGDWAAQ